MVNRWNPKALFFRATHDSRRSLHSISMLTIGVLAMFVFGAMFRAGIDRGMDQMIPQEAHGRIVQGIAAVLTDLRSKEHGYALSNTIVSELFNRGLTVDPATLNRLGVKAPDNLRSAIFIDHILDDMWRDVWGLRADDVRGFGADDIGIIDYTGLSFWLFGHQIRSLYYMFFVILGATLVVGLVERRRDPAGQLLIITALGLLYAICFFSNIFDNEPTKHISAMAG